MKSVTLAELGKKLGLNVIGDETRVINSITTPENGKPDVLCVIWDTKNLKYLSSDVPIIGKPEFFNGERLGLASLNPKATLPELLKFFAKTYPEPKGIHPLANVAAPASSAVASISEDIWIGPFCTIESSAVLEPGVRLMGSVYVGHDVKIGSGTLVEPNVTLMAGTSIGKHCLLHAGCVLGCDGFGFLSSSYSSHSYQSSSSQNISYEANTKIPQIGNVIIGDNVEIGACSTIDRGTIGDTIIGDGTKIDNHVQIGHNVHIGKCCIICSMTGIAGSSVVEDGVTVSVQVGITDHVRVGKGAILAGRSGVTNDVPAGSVVSGFPARPHNEAKRSQVLLTRLPELYERLKRLECVSGLEHRLKK